MSSLESLKLSLKNLQGGKGDLSEPCGNERTAVKPQSTSTASLTPAQPQVALTTPVHPGSFNKLHTSSVDTRLEGRDTSDRSRTNTMTNERPNIGAPVRFNTAALLDAYDSSDDDNEEKKDTAKKSVSGSKPTATVQPTGPARPERRAINLAETPSILRQKLDPALTPTVSLLKKPLPASSESGGSATRSLTGLSEHCSSVGQANYAPRYAVRPADEHHIRPCGAARTAGETSNSGGSTSTSSNTIHVSPLDNSSSSVMSKPQNVPSIAGLPPTKLHTAQSAGNTKPPAFHHQASVPLSQPRKPSNAVISDHLKSSSASSRESKLPLSVDQGLQHDSQQTNIQASPPCSHQITVNGRTYWVLAQLGKGACGKVYRALTGNQRIVAIKHIDLRDFTDLSSHEREQLVESNLNEIRLLHLLQNSPHIIKLFSWELRESRQELFLVMECGDGDLASHLAGLRQRQEEQGHREPMPRLVESWYEMLLAVNAIHEQRVVHSDLKPANFVFVRGVLKLIDFGIASKLAVDVTSVARETQIGTPNYMAPEMINVKNYHSNCKVNPKSDVWSLGCILYLMVYGKTPFQNITNQIKKFQAIIDDDFKIPFPPLEDVELLDVLKQCLTRDLQCRPSVKDLLVHPFTRRIQWMKAPLTGSALEQLLISEINNLTPASRSRVIKAVAPAQQEKSHDDEKLSGRKTVCNTATLRTPLQERTNTDSFQQLMASLASAPAVAIPGGSKSHVQPPYR